jgi:serine/threonine protein kinase
VEPPAVIPGYEIGGVLGRGGMGVVYGARDVKLDRRVAIKVLRSGVSGDRRFMVQRFEREARAAARIDSPHAAHVLQFGETADGAPFLVFELIDGRELKKELVDAPFAPARAVAIAKQICAGMGAAHDQGVVHRDLKPSNILLVDKGGTRDFVKIIDFGVAKLVDEEAITETGALVGTASYMAPEQLTGDVVDLRADVYAFGLTLHEMLTGKRAFQADTLPDLTSAELAGFSWAKLDTRVRLPSGLLDVVAQCLAAKREHRLQTMYDVALALDAAMDTPFASVGAEARTVRTLGPNDVTERQASEEAFDTDRGSAVVTRAAPGVLVATIRGVADEPIYEFVRDRADAEFPRLPRGEKLVFFFDTTGMTAFHKRYREKMTEWQGETKGTMQQVVLLRSRLIALAISAANAITGGGATVTANRARYDKALAAAVAKRAAHTSSTSPTSPTMNASP